MISRRIVLRLSALLFVIGLVALAIACGGDDEETSPASPSPVDSPAGTTAGAAVTFPPVPTFAGCPTPGGAVPEVQTKSYPERPAMSIDPSRRYLAHVYTTRGHFIIELLPGVAPEHVNSFVFLARDKFYNGTTFHRVIPDFVAQGGDPTGLGNGGPGYTVPLEPSEEPFVRGVVGMARSQDPDSAGSQFFITYAPAPNLDGQYTVFGKVVEGMEFVDCLTPRDPSTDPNAPPGDAIIDIAIQEI